MKLKFSKNTSIGELQNQFKNIFPYLKLEFFVKPHGSGVGSRKELIINDSSLQLSKLSSKLDETEYAISETTTVNDLEQYFKNELGINVQVFRRSGNSWLETTATDSWTLAKQNTEGKEITNFKLGK